MIRGYVEIIFDIAPKKITLRFTSKGNNNTNTKKAHPRRWAFYL